MTRKKKIRMIVIMPTMVTLLIIASLLTLVFLIGTGRSEATSMAAPAAAASAGASFAETTETAPACAFPAWVGQPVDESALQALHRPYRIIKPGDAVTEDYSADRVNVETDGQGVVTKVHCG